MQERYARAQYGYLVDGAGARSRLMVAQLRVCLVVDAGCTSSVSSANVVDHLQSGRCGEEAEARPDIAPSNKEFHLANSQTRECVFQGRQHITRC
eukprot:827494-Lingulodinium_polyedra.AAC.1